MMEWRAVAGFDGRYEVSQVGWVRSHALKRPRLLKLVPAKRGGYLTVHLGGRVWLVHRLVAEAFLDPRPEGCALVRHLDGDNLNNAVFNLAWGTHAENSADARRHGTTLRGERSNTAKLTDADVLEIRRLAATGMTGREISSLFPVVEQTINRVIARRGWTHV